ncbi:MAG: hypothetical protein ACXADX_12375 [Candidatus Hodarchaeales archaeon]|jgi:hypothetical protein
MLTAEEKARLEEIARSVGLKSSALADIILQTFLQEEGGSVFSGTWRRGDTDRRKGRRIVVQWPFKSALAKIDGNEFESFEHPEGPSYRKMPDGDFLGYPRLEKEEIRLAATRKGRIVVLFEHEEYRKFLSAIKSKHGTLDPGFISQIAHEAIMNWVQRVEESITPG